MTDNELVIQAIKARECAYAPYSNYRVGAALLTKSGKVYTGCNIENAAYSPTVCAERVAFFKAVTDGEREFEKIAIVGGKSGLALYEAVTPCGVCRQVMTEFCKPDFGIVLIDGENGYKTVTLGELLPHAFSQDNLK